MSIKTLLLNSSSKLLVILTSKERLQAIELKSMPHLFKREPSYVIGVEISVIV